VFTKPLPSAESLPCNDRRDTHTDIQSDEREIVSFAMIYITSFTKIGSGIQKLTRGIHRHTDSMISRPTFIFSKEGK
jgi:hypothetical protein